MSNVNGHRCPECNYDLRAAERDGDDRVTCSECGKTWNWDNCRVSVEPMRLTLKQQVTYFFPGLSAPLVVLLLAIVLRDERAVWGTMLGMLLLHSLVVSILTTRGEAFWMLRVIARFVTISIVNALVCVATVGVLSFLAYAIGQLIQLVL